MPLQILKSKIHNAFVTEADIAGLMEGEQVRVINHRSDKVRGSPSFTCTKLKLKTTRKYK